MFVSEIMKVALRFEKLIQERKAQESTKTQTDGDILNDIICSYNSFKANTALKRWQISPDQHSAILGVIVGMSHESRQLVRAHLDFNKWEESGYLAKQF